MLWAVHSASRTPAETKNYSVLRNAETGPGANLASFLEGTGDLCPGINCHSFPTGVEVKTVSIYTAIPLYVSMVRTETILPVSL